MSSGEKFLEQGKAAVIPDNAFVAWLERWGSIPFFGAITTSLTILTGCLASFFTEAIKTETWFAGRLGLSPFVKTSMFWGGVLVCSLFLWWGLWAQARKARTASSKMEDMLTALQGLPTTSSELKGLVQRLQTLPSDRYLPSYASHYSSASQVAFQVMLSGDKSVPAIETAIRIVLRMILNTAIDFDKASPKAVYSANLMLWRPKDDNGNASFEAEAPEEILEHTLTDAGAAGFLELIPELSTTSAGYVVPDANLAPYVLPVPSVTEEALDSNLIRRSKVIPGAPWAFVTEEMAQFVDADKFAEWIDRKLDVNHSGATKLKDYFYHGEGKHIHSFVSIPIMAPTWADRFYEDGSDNEDGSEGGEGKETSCAADTSTPNEATREGNSVDGTVEVAAAGAQADTELQASQQRDADEEQQKQDVECDPVPVAILNVNSSEDNLLADNGSTLFVPLLEPFLALLSILLMLRDDQMALDAAWEEEYSAGPSVSAS